MSSHVIEERIFRIREGLFVVFRFYPEESEFEMEDKEVERETREKINSGELEHFKVSARVYFQGVQVGDPSWLGSCVYASIDDFFKDSSTVETLALEALDECKRWGNAFAAEWEGVKKTQASAIRKALERP